MIQPFVPETVVFVSFENHYAPWGGLSAVMKRLPPIMSKHVKTILFSPLFYNMESTKEALEDGRIESAGLRDSVLYKGYSHAIELYKSTEYEENENYALYLVKCDKFFTAGRNPYHDSWRIDSLFHDSYFFTKSVPIALNLIRDEFPPPYIIHAQDWETALVTETMPPDLSNKCVITLHNPYDNKLLNDLQGRTILQLTIPKMAGLSTVSEHFAHELTHDVLQKEVICKRLQGQFQFLEPIGINNGIFADKSLPPGCCTTNSICAEKWERRVELNELFKNEPTIQPAWGQKFDFLDDEVPLFLLFGREAPNQKGFDVAAASIYKLLNAKGTKAGYFVFTPIMDSSNLDPIAYLEDLCKTFPDNVMVFPFRLSKGYPMLQKAANYIIMPSYYEPFGAATEGYAAGTPVIARATGGLLQQVCPLNMDSLPGKIQEYVKWYHEDVSKATGFMYREHPTTETADNWNYLRITDFSKRRPIQEPVDWRNPLFWSMVSELQNCLEDAINLFRNDKDKYSTLILNGLALMETFSWEKSALHYKTRLYGISN